MINEQTMHDFVFNEITKKTFLCRIKNHEGSDFEQEVEAKNINEAVDKFLKMGLGKAGWGKEEVKKHTIEESKIDEMIDNEIKANKLDRFLDVLKHNFKSYEKIAWVVLIIGYLILGIAILFI